MDSAIGQVCITNPEDRQAPPKSFTFDGAYYIDSTTEQMYNEIVFSLVEVSPCYVLCTQLLPL